MATTRKKATRKSPAKRATKRKAPAKKKGARKKGDFGLLDLVRNPLLASIGAFSLAEEGLERLVSELIDREIRRQTDQLRDDRDQLAVLSGSMWIEELPDDLALRRDFERAAKVRLGDQGVAICKPLHRTAPRRKK